MIWIKLNHVNKFTTLLNASIGSRLKCLSRKATLNRQQRLMKDKFEFKRDMLVYELTNHVTINQLWTAGFATFGLCMYSAFELQHLDTIDKHIERDELLDDSKFTAIVYGFSSFVNYFSVPIGVLIALIGCGIFAGCNKYVTSSIKRIHLLKGGQNVTLELFRANPFSTNFKKMNVPLKDISFTSYRGEKGNYIYFKIFKHRTTYQVHKEGKFDETLFDQVICFQRNIDEKK